MIIKERPLPGVSPVKRRHTLVKEAIKIEPAYLVFNVVPIDLLVSADKSVQSK